MLLTMEKPISGQIDSPAFCINYLVWHFYSSVEVIPFGTERDVNISLKVGFGLFSRGAY